MRGNGEQRSTGTTGVEPGTLTALLAEIAQGPEAGRGSAWDEGLWPGAVVGRFELVREIGRGAFGVVYEAVDRELHRRVAFKAVRAGEAVKLLPEAEAAARLSHPNIVHLYDHGSCEHGPYLILELLEGETLDERLREGKLAPREALRVVVEVARGVAHAHGKGVVHRDLKPGNVFVCEDGQVKVLDFGLALVFGRSGRAGGTPAYMSPEQARGEVGDERSDVYALGAMLFELLTGKLPYDPKGERGVPAGGEAPEVAGAPAALKKLLARMLAQEPKDRHRNGEEAHAELAAFQKSIEPRKRPWVAWSVAACAGIAAAIAIPPACERLPPGRLLAVMADAANDTGDADFDVAATLLRTALEPSRRLSLVDRARLIRSGATGGRVDEAAARRAAREVKASLLLLPTVHRADPGVEAELRAIDPVREEPVFTVRVRAAAKGGWLAALDALVARAREALEESDKDRAAKTRLEEVIPQRPEVWHAWEDGRRLVAEGDRAGARKAFERCLELDPEFPMAHVDLAKLLQWRDLDVVKAHLDAARRGIHRVPPKERLQIEATTLVTRWKIDEAIGVYDKIIAGWPQDPQAYLDAGQQELQHGRLQHARPYMEQALALGAIPEGRAIEHLAMLGRLDEALQRAERWVETSPGRTSYLLLGAVHRLRGDTGRLREVVRRAAAAGIATLGRTPSELFEGDWNYIEADAFEEYEAAIPGDPWADPGYLYFRGLRRKALAILAEHPAPPGTPAVQRGNYHVARAVFLSGDDDGDPSAVWSELGQGALLGHSGIGCFVYPLARMGDLSHGKAFRNYLTFYDEGQPCTRMYQLAVDWSRGDLEGAARGFAGVSWSESVFRLGDVLVELGRNREAVEAFRRYRRWPEFNGTYSESYYPRSLYLEAVALERLGERDEALKAVDRLLRLWERADREIPTFQKAKALRKRLLAAGARVTP